VKEEAMRPSRLLQLGCSALLFTACDEQATPTAPGDEPDSPSLSQAAGDRVVNSVADPGDGVCNSKECTLREAINDPQSTRITFAPGLAGPITLARPGEGGGRLDIERSLTITGPSQRIAIRGRNPDLAFPVFRIGDGARVSLTNLIIRRGGGGILNRGTLTVTDCLITGNGYGIHNTFGDLTLNRSAVADNTSAGVWFSGGTGRLGQDRITRNSGGGLAVGSATVTMANSTIDGNSSRDDGGGISLVEGRLTVLRSSITNNSAAGQGGGVFNRSDNVFRRGGASISLLNSTVSGNSASFGGGIANSPLRGQAGIGLRNTTVTGNSASQEGGGIYQNGPENDEDFGGLGLVNSLVARNNAPTAPDLSVVSGFLTARSNLIGVGSGSGVTNGVDGNQVGTVAAPIDPKLGALGDHGGSTQTHPLLAGSPAIDAGSAADCPDIDQRGVSRPQGPGCDIGSYERK
jgi:CSLREA domain-containing protein